MDKNRVLLVFAPTDRDQRLQKQLTLLRPCAAEMKDRDLTLLLIFASSGAPATPATLHPPVLSDVEQLTIRHRFRVLPGDFAAILLGKDGGEKLRSATPISSDRLNRTIDAMPMRRQDMRERTP